MTTKEFIEILQKEDPSGNAHIRMDGGIPFFAERKPGYWDGPYAKLDEEGNYVYTTEGEKVDIHCIDIDSFVDRNFHYFDSEKSTWEYIESKFKFNLGYVNQSDKDSRAQNILKKAKESFDMCKEIQQDLFKRELDECLQHNEEGWTWFQNKEVDNKDLNPNWHYFYTWKIYNKDGKEQGSNPYNTNPILFSGLFERLDNNVNPGYYQWIKK